MAFMSKMTTLMFLLVEPSHCRRKEVREDMAEAESSPEVETKSPQLQMSEVRAWPRRMGDQSAEAFFGNCDDKEKQCKSSCQHICQLGCSHFCSHGALMCLLRMYNAGDGFDWHPPQTIDCDEWWPIQPQPRPTPRPTPQPTPRPTPPPPPTNPLRIAKVQIRAGRLVDEVTFWFNKKPIGSESYNSQIFNSKNGGKDHDWWKALPSQRFPKKRFWEVPAGQYINVVEGRKGKKLDRVRFGTDKGVWSPWFGKTGGKDFRLRASPGKAITGLINDRSGNTMHVGLMEETPNAMEKTRTKWPWKGRHPRSERPLVTLTDKR